MAPAAITIGLLIGLTEGPSQAQEPTTAPTFEVASIRENKTGGRKKPSDPPTPVGSGGILQPQGDRFRALNVTLRTLIRAAYGVADGDLSTPESFDEYRIVGGPSWIGSNAFDIEARMPDGARSPGDRKLMLRALLVERFGLKVHREIKEMPAYALVKARRDGRLAERLRPRSEQCVPEKRPVSAQPIRCGVRVGPGSFSGNGVTISTMATYLSPLVDRVVIDRTDLAGVFDFEVRFTPELGAGRSTDARSRNDQHAPSIFTGLPEQLGLKLESIRARVDVLVIDNVQRPSAD